MLGKWKDKMVDAAKGAVDKTKEAANDAIYSTQDTFNDAVDGMKGLAELSKKLGRDFSATLDRSEIMELVRRAGDIPMIGKPFQAVVVLAKTLEFLASLPGQTSRTITNDHLSEDDPLIVVPMERFLMVLSFSDETDWRCNFYRNDDEIINELNLNSLKGDTYVARGLQSEKYGINRVSYANVDGLNRYPQVSQTPEKGISTAIDMALGYIPGYDYIEYIPYAGDAVEKAIEGLSKTIVHTVIADLTNHPELANDNRPE